jgi:hypothetical protein
MFPLRFTLLGGSFFCLLGHGSFHFVPCIPRFFWVLWFIFDWQGFIIPNAHFAYTMTSYLQSKNN